jgi:hypothetical protein
VPHWETSSEERRKFIARKRPVILGEFNLGYGQNTGRCTTAVGTRSWVSAHELEIKRHRLLDTRSIEVAPSQRERARRCSFCLIDEEDSVALLGLLIDA